MMEEDKKKDSGKEIPEDKDAEEMDEDELFSDDEEFGSEPGETWEQVRMWFQDNLRVILSVLIVALIAVGIYNYSKKPADQSQPLAGEQGVEVQQGEQPQQPGEQPSAGVQVQNQNDNSAPVVVKGGEQPGQTAAPQQPQTPAEKTGEGYTAKADAGEGVTNLARKATREYLNANNDSTLSKEQKIYIEDYLRKHVAQGRLRVGDSRTFSESMIKDAITQAKSLNERQLKNLQKYSARVSNL